MMGDETTVLIPLLRSRLHHLLSQGFYYPERALMELAQQRDEWTDAGARLGVWMDAGELGERVGAVVNALHGAELSALRREYEHLFGHAIARDCPLYETDYGSAHIFMQAQQLSDIAAFYRAFYLEISEEIKERLDHIGIELEFMHFLTCKEAYARAYHGEEQAQVCVDAQRKFLKDHLGRWAPLLARLLRRKSAPGVYSALAALLEEFIDVECRYVGVSPLALEERDIPAGAYALDQEACAGCELATGPEMV